MANVEIASHFIDADGVRTHYLEAGEGPPLVLVHGGGAGADSLGNWQDCFPILTRHFRVIAPDMIGFGRTDKPSPDDYTYDQPGRNRHMAAFLDAMGLSGVAIVGNSMGGATAIGVALDRPELIGTLVLMGSAGLPIPERPSPHLLQNLHYDFTMEGMRRVIGGLTAPGFVPSEAMVRYRYDLVDDEASRAALAAINAETRKGTLNYDEDRLRTIHQPTLVVNGKEDGVSILPRAYRFLELLPNSWGYIVPHCGHWAMIEATEDFCGAVLRFLKVADVTAPAGVHAMIEHLVRHPAERGYAKSDPDALFDRFAVDPAAREVLRTGSRDALSGLGMHGNYVIKWLIWSGRPTLPFFAMSHFFDRR